jgi:hypothetical protein
MVEDIIVKCGRKKVSTMIIVITKASMNMELERIRRYSPSSFYHSPSVLSILLFIFLPSCPLPQTCQLCLPALSKLDF